MTKIVWIPRSTWGASQSTEDFIDRRTKVPAEDKTEIHVHHTAAIDDDDSTPNRWDYNEALAYMRRLQWARPDLGPLPYCDNLAVSENLELVWFFEGRGALTLGAHTGGHNWPGYGVGAFGNFDKPDTAAARVIVQAIEWRIAQLRADGLANLGTVKNSHGWNAWGHRDTSTKTCPGHSLYPLLEHFTLSQERSHDMQWGWPNAPHGLGTTNPTLSSDIRATQILLGREPTGSRGPSLANAVVAALPDGAVDANGDPYTTDKLITGDQWVDSIILAHLIHQPVNLPDDLARKADVRAVADNLDAHTADVQTSTPHS